MDWFSPAEDRIYELARRLLTEYVESRPEYGREWILAGGVTCTGSFLRRMWYPWPVPAEARRLYYWQIGARNGAGNCSLSASSFSLSHITLDYGIEERRLEEEFAAWLSVTLRGMDGPYCFTVDDDRTLAIARRILTEFVRQHPGYEKDLAEIIFSTGSKQNRMLGPQVLAHDVTNFRFNQNRVRGTATAIGRFSLIDTAGKIAELEVNYDNGAVESDGQLEAWLSEELRKLP
jgi:hypothetical protein